MKKCENFTLGNIYYGGVIKKMKLVTPKYFLKITLQYCIVYSKMIFKNLDENFFLKKSPVNLLNISEDPVRNQSQQHNNHKTNNSITVCHESRFCTIENNNFSCGRAVRFSPLCNMESYVFDGCQLEQSI